VCGGSFGLLDPVTCPPLLLNPGVLRRRHKQNGTNRKQKQFCCSSWPMRSRRCAHLSNLLTSPGTPAQQAANTTWPVSHGDFLWYVTSRNLRKTITLILRRRNWRLQGMHADRVCSKNWLKETSRPSAGNLSSHVHEATSSKFIGSKNVSLDCTIEPRQYWLGHGTNASKYGTFRKYATVGKMSTLI